MSLGDSSKTPVAKDPRNQLRAVLMVALRGTLLRRGLLELFAVTSSVRSLFSSASASPSSSVAMNPEILPRRDAVRGTLLDTSAPVCNSLISSRN